MQSHMHYQHKQSAHQPAKPFDNDDSPDEPVEIQLRSAMDRISELQRRKDYLRMELVSAARELEMKYQLLRNAEVREQELRAQF